MSYFFKNIDLAFMCLYASLCVRVRAQRPEERVSPLEIWAALGCWELNASHLQEPQVLFITELSLLAVSLNGSQAQCLTCGECPEHEAVPISEATGICRAIPTIKRGGMQNPNKSLHPTSSEPQECQRLWLRVWLCC